MRFKRGFTLIEIMIASAVLTLFFGGAFAYWRMGSNMYIAGSWKLNKSKEAERFLSALKEHIEACTNAAIISRERVIQSRASFCTLRDQSVISSSTFAQNSQDIMFFSICKPQMLELASKPRGDEAAGGLILYSCLRAVRNPKRPNLLDLELYVSTTVNGDSTEYFSSSPPEAFPDTASLDVENSSFNSAPRSFGILAGRSGEAGAYSHLYRLTDVATLSVSVLEPTADRGSLGSVIGLRVSCVCPSQPRTDIANGIQAQVDSSVSVSQNLRGGA